MNLVLCGMMGAGKSTIGIKIAELTGRRWYDTDGVISDRYGKISDIFEYYGEPHFRKLETEIVKELAEQDPSVPEARPFQHQGDGPPQADPRPGLLRQGLIAKLRQKSRLRAAFFS